MSDVLLKNAHILSMDPTIGEIPIADIRIRDGRIEGMGPGIATRSADEIVDCSGMIAIPGLINAHLHSPATFLKGRLNGAPLEIFMLYEVPPLGDTPEPPRLNYLRTVWSAMEMLKLGITSVVDDAFFNPIVTNEAIDAIMEGYRDSGMRARVALDQPTVIEYDKYPFLKDILPSEAAAAMAAAPRQSEPELLTIYADFIHRWHEAEGGRLGCAVSCSAPQRISPDYLLALTELSREHDLTFNIHMLETRLQRVLGDLRYGKSMVRFVHDLGALDPRKLVIHGIWIDDRDIELLAQSGCTIAHNPVCNLRLGSGIMPWHQLRESGVPIALGTDEAAADDTLNLWQAMKMAGLIHNLTGTDWNCWPLAREILETMYKSGAGAMRLHGDIGVLREGAQADITLLNKNSMALTPLNDLTRQLVYCENGSSVAKVFVAGQQVVEDGRLLSIDEAAIRAEIAALGDELGAQWRQTAAHAAQLEPFYRQMIARSLDYPVTMQRRAGT